MTELTWDGKYSKDGKKTAPVRIALPFQTIETVNESAQDRLRTLDLFAQGKPTEWRNRLIWGDKKYVLPSLLPEFAGKVNLIYIDPPFDTGADFSFNATIPDNPETPEDETTTFIKQPSILEVKAYRDTWGRDPDTYLQWFWETVVFLRELLDEDGSLYVHLDSRKVHHAKLILDEVFGADNFRNQIPWKRTNAHGNATYQFGQIHDMLLFYARSEKAKLNQLYAQYDDRYIETFFKYVEEETGRRFRSQNLVNYNKDRPNLNYEWNGHKRTWLFTKEKMEELDIQGKIIYSSTGYPSMKQYLDESPGVPLGDFWHDLKALKHSGHELAGYPTQKPEALLERVIKASSNENDLILDCFCGSGTTATVAEKSNRRWIACDLGRFAIHTTRKRLLGIEGVKPFVVQNLGKYERQQWMGAEFQNLFDKRMSIEQRYRHFILQLYGAEPVAGHAWLHGAKAGRMAHVGSVDSPVSDGDVKSIVQEFWKAVGKTEELTNNGIDILGWDFAFEINETAIQVAAANKVDLKFKKIPTEVLEKKAVDQGDIKFYELAALNANVAVESKTVKIELSDFIMPLDDIPQEVRGAITHWSQWIDYWSVDWDYKDDTFHNQWQSYRTRKDMSIELQTSKKYKQAGKYSVVIKVIDILGNDTTKMVEVEVS